MKRTYHPASWSQQARKMADNNFKIFVEANECGDPESWMLQRLPIKGFTYADEELYIENFSISYRPAIIRHRAAKRFGRLVRKYRKG